VGWSVVGLVRSGAAAHPDAPMLTGAGPHGTVVTRTWAEEDERSSKVANALAAAGIGPGDRIAFLDKNGLAYFDVLFGAAKLNAVTVAVNWRLAAPEMAQIIGDAGASVLFVSRDFVGALGEVEGDIPSVRQVIVVDGDAAPYPSLEAWIDGVSGADPAIEPDGADVALQLYTSGTTGLPKGAMLTNDNFASIVPEFTGELGMDGTSVNMAAMPLFHIGGSGWAILGLANGAHTVVVREVDPALVLDAIVGDRITHAFLVPAVLQFMLALPGIDHADLSSLQLIAYGASPIADEVLRRCLATFGCGFMQLYGMTETTGAITLLRAAEHEPGGPHAERLRSCGVPFRGVSIEIVDPESGHQVPVDTVGEIWTRSAQNMLGYWRKPDETAKTITADGWLRTGDAGYRDADGFIYLHDRIKDMIVSGGENVYPAEVENILMSHPAVADCAVIGVPSERWGETVKAIVVAAGERPDPAELIGFCRQRLAHYKCPTSVDFTDALPRNPSGKVLKRQLRMPYWQGSQRQIS
jgi:long-chain acyl-CoA synthetase